MPRFGAEYNGRLWGLGARAMGGNLLDAVEFLVRTLGLIYFYCLGLRLLMRAAQVDFYNPISQAIVTLTSPVVNPLGRLLPTVRGVDLAVLAAAVLAQLVVAGALALFKGLPVFAPVYVGWALVGLLAGLIDLCFVALIILVVVSWVAPDARHPGVALVAQLTEPLCAPVRRLLPAVGGLDFSVMAVLLGLIVVDQFLVVRPLADLLGASRWLVPAL